MGSLLKIVLGLLLITLVLLGVQTYRYETYKSAVQIAQYKAERVAREKEAGWRAGIDRWVRDYVNKRKVREEHLQSVIADLRTGSIRVRKRLSCPPVTSSGGDVGAEGGLSREDAEFLLREAARADALAEQLRLLQEYVKVITNG